MSSAVVVALSLIASDPAPATASSASAPVDQPAPAQPKYRGTGLLTATGLLAGTSLALTIARNAKLAKDCPLDPKMPVACTYSFKTDLGLAAGQWSLNLANVGVAPGAGVMLARYHAWKDAGTGKQRKLGAIMGAGGAVLGVGAVGVISSVALAFTMSKRCLDKEIDSGDPLAGDRCLRRAYAGWTMWNWSSFAMVSAGAAMLAYGSTYKRHASKREQRVQVSPYGGRGQAGVMVAGRF